MAHRNRCFTYCLPIKKKVIFHDSYWLAVSHNQMVNPFDHPIGPLPSEVCKVVDDMDAPLTKRRYYQYSHHYEFVPKKAGRAGCAGAGCGEKISKGPTNGPV